MDFISSTTTSSRIEFFPRKRRMLHELSFSVRSMNNEKQTDYAGGFKHSTIEMTGINGFDIHSTSCIEKDRSLQIKKYKLKVLHIEDDEEVRFLMKSFLKPIVQLESVVNGKDALTKISETLFDLIITDINLGNGLNGIDIAKKIRKFQNYKHVPIIAVTAYGESEVKSECMNAGMDAFLMKPFFKQELVETIGKVVHQRP